MDINGLRSKLSEHGQVHLLQYWDNLSEDEKAQLLNDLNRLNYGDINRYFKAAQETLNSASTKIDDQLQPLPPDVCGRITATSQDTLNNYQAKGIHIQRF